MEGKFRNFSVVYQYFGTKISLNSFVTDNSGGLNYDSLMTWKKLPVNASNTGKNEAAKGGTDQTSKVRLSFHFASVRLWRFVREYSNS